MMHIGVDIGGPPVTRKSSAPDVRAAQCRGVWERRVAPRQSGLSRPTASRSHPRGFEIQSMMNAIPRERTPATQTPGPGAIPGEHGARARRAASLLAQWQ